MKKTFRRKVLGLLITILLSLAMVVFLLGLARTKLFPVKILLLAGGAFLMFAVIVGLLTRDSRRTGSMLIGILLTFAILAGLVLGTNYLVGAVNTLNDLTQVKVEVADIGVFVRQDDPAADINAAVAYDFGIIADLDRENTDQAISDLEKELNAELNVTEFSGLEELVDGLLSSRDVDAIVINSAYLALLGDMEGYQEAEGQMRELHARQVENVIQVPVETTKPEENKGLLDQLLNNQPEEETPNRSFAMYISGVDSRKMSAKSRSDVNILAVVNPDTRQVLLISTPRDYYVPLSISNGQPDKLTHAGIYGINVSVDTMEMLYNTQIDYYFRVNFSGFEKIIDALGGITVHSDYAFTTLHGNYSIKKGENKMNGAKALCFARERYAFTAGDRQRGKNQMAVIKAVIDKAMSPAILTNYSKLMDSVSGYFETSMPYDQIAELVREQLDKGGTWNIVTYSVDGTGASKKPYSLSSKAYVMVPKQETVDAAIEKIQQVRNGEILE